MAVLSKFLLYFADGRNKISDSKGLDILFQSLSVSSDGSDQGMQISSTGTAFDFNAKAITNVGLVDGVDVGNLKTAYDSHVADAAGKHNADQIALEDAGANFTATEVEAAFLEVDGRIDTAQALAAAALPKSGGTMEGAIAMGGYDISGLPAAPVGDTSATRKDWVVSQIASAGAASEWQDSVLSRLADPPGSPSTGDRHLVIAEYNGATWDFTTPTAGTYVSVDAETDGIYLFTSVWTKKIFEATTASTGLTKSGVDIQVDPSLAGVGLAFAAGVMSVGVDSSSIEIDTDALRVKALGITNAMLGGSIADAKMASDYVQTSEVDDSSIEWSGTALQVKASGVTSDMLAGSIADGKLASDYVQTSEVDDSSIEFGTSLNVKAAGITNDMLAGSIADSKLSQLTTANKVAGSAVQLNSGATLENSTGLAVNYKKSFLNNTGLEIASGKLVFIFNNAGVAEIKLADKDDASSNDYDLGITSAAIAHEASGAVQYIDGAVVGGFSALVPGQIVYVADDGALSHTAPTASGDHVYKAGRAFSTTEIELQSAYMHEIV